MAGPGDPGRPRGDRRGEIGRDLGRLPVNTRAFERERVAVRELRALDAYKGQLIATLSHELKSPLATPLAEESAAVLAAVDRGATRLVRVVEDLLLLARVGDPHSRLQARPVDLRAVLDEVLALTAITAQTRVRTRFVGDAEDLVVLGAAPELEILIGNLVSNALKYSDDDAPVCLEIARWGDQVQITCTDHGLGIDDADLGRLFEEFFRSEATEVRRRPGTGLGLAIVERIVARHGGRIEVESALGVGTTFRLHLPAAPR